MTFERFVLNVKSDVGFVHIISHQANDGREFDVSVSLNNEVISIPLIANNIEYKCLCSLGQVNESSGTDFYGPFQASEPD